MEHLQRECDKLPFDQLEAGVLGADRFRQSHEVFNC
jgi:hypothetical protein